MLCQPSIATAANRTAASNSSWPMPEAAADNAPAKPATASAPTVPAATPPATQAPRPGAPRLAAMTMPTISAASRISRKTIMAAASIVLLHHDEAARGLVEIVDELVAARLQRPDRQA